MGYDSDLESDDELLDDDEDSVDDQESTANECDRDGEPPVKRIQRRLNEPVLVTWLKKRERRTKKWKQALHDIENSHSPEGLSSKLETMVCSHIEHEQSSPICEWW